MRKLSLILLFLALGCTGLQAQTGVNANLTAADAGTCATANACLALRIPQNVGGATFTITTNASGNTVQFEASGDNGATWVALNVTPSNSTTAVTSTTATGTWQANVAGYTHARMRISTLAGGSTASSINPSTASARAGGGGIAGAGTFGPNYSIGGGIAQAQTVAPTTAVTNALLVNGYELCWLPIADNTGAAPTLAGSGTSTFSAKPITKYPGTSALVAGDISATNGSIACARYDGVEFQLLNPQTGWATGVVPRSQTTTSDTIVGTDRGNGIIENNGGAIAVTTTSTLGVAPLDKNFFFFIKDIGVGTATITPTGGAQIAGSNGTLGASLAVTTGQTAYCYSDNTNFQCTVVTTGATGALVQVPATTAANTVAPTTDIVGMTVLQTTAGAPASDIFDVCTNTAGACGTKILQVNPNQTVGVSAALNVGAAFLQLHTASFGDYINANETSSLTHNLPDMGGTFLIRQTTPIHLTAQTAAISTATLCAATAGNCNKAGNYTVEWAFTQTGTACGTPGAGGVTFLLTWTDQNGTAHSATSLAMDDSASLVATTGTFHFTTSNATAWASGQFNISSNGSIIQYATGYTACGVGTGSYQIDAWVTRTL